MDLKKKRVQIQSLQFNWTLSLNNQSPKTLKTKNIITKVQFVISGSKPNSLFLSLSSSYGRNPRSDSLPEPEKLIGVEIPIWVLLRIKFRYLGFPQNSKFSTGIVTPFFNFRFDLFSFFFRILVIDLSCYCEDFALKSLKWLYFCVKRVLNKLLEVYVLRFLFFQFMLWAIWSFSSLISSFS